jgi:hypothetical protein
MPQIPLDFVENPDERLDSLRLHLQYRLDEMVMRGKTKQVMQLLAMLEAVEVSSTWIVIEERTNFVEKHRVVDTVMMLML